MPRYKITVTEDRPLPADVTATEVSALGHCAPAVVFEQTFDDLNLRNFVRTLNATPRRRKKSAA